MHFSIKHRGRVPRCVVGVALAMLATVFNIFLASAQKPVHLSRKPLSRTQTADSVKMALSQLPDSIPLSGNASSPDAVVEESISLDDDSLSVVPVDTIAVLTENDASLLFDSGTVVDSLNTSGRKVFIPDPTKAVWYSALCPGLGQIYNRRFWKLPIVVGGFMGLGYGASWNNGMLRDYTRAYNDFMDNDPDTKSYMNFFPPNTSENSLNKTWLERTLKNRKDYFRRNRDLCIIAMVGVYLLAVVDAYVDASLTNFDISPDLTMQVAPALLRDIGSPWPALGVQWAVNF